jgi:hypothetical protein
MGGRRNKFETTDSTRGIYDSFNGCNKHYSKQRVWDSRRAGKSIHLKTDNYTGLFIASYVFTRYILSSWSIPILTGIYRRWMRLPCCDVLWERCFCWFYSLSNLCGLRLYRSFRVFVYSYLLVMSFFAITIIQTWHTKHYKADKRLYRQPQYI